MNKLTLQRSSVASESRPLSDGTMIHDAGIGPGFDMDERGVKAAVKYTTSTLLSGRCSMNHIASCFAGRSKAIGVFDNNLHQIGRAHV